MPSSGITSLLDAPFYTGSSTTSLVPGVFPVGLNGRGYILDLDSKAMAYESIPLVRNQFLTGTRPGEGAISLDDLWRRTEESWHLGAGQVYADRDDSLEGRYRSSKGVDPWTKWQLSLLPDTKLALSSSNTNLRLTVAGGYLYVTDGQVLKYTTDVTAGPPATWTSVTGHPAVTALSICSDGNNVYVAYNASGIYKTTRGGAAQASFATGTVALVRYVKGRLMAANGASIYNVTGAGALPTALFTHGNSDFAWVDFAEGPDYLYAAGFSGDKSLIYKCAVRSDGTALDVPSVAGELPDGEIVRSVQGYLGFLLIGTDLGLRVAQIASSGALVIGPLISTNAAVQCFEPQNRFCWYGYTNYDGTSTGLGRLDLSIETDPGQPPFASDLMATGQGAVLSAATFQSIRVFTVSALGVYAQHTNLVSSATLDTGFLSYGIPEPKTAVKVLCKTAPLAGSYTVSLAVDGGTFNVLTGTMLATGDTTAEFNADEVRGERFELRYTLTRAAGNTTGPTIYRVMLKVDPSAALNMLLTVPLLLHEHLTLPNGGSRTMDPAFELALLFGLRETRSIVIYQDLITQYTVVVKDFKWVPYADEANRRAMDGTCIVELKTIS